MPPPDPRPATHDPDLPERIGKYRVLDRLGEGATAEVFLARDEFNQRDVAIKRVREATLGDGAEGRYREHFFAAEAALAGRLQHPNVVQIYDAEFDAKAPYLVMEYVPGVTLRKFCRTNALLPLSQVVEIGFKCAKALSYVFRQGLIHRDVKPANILALMENDRVVDIKLSDFGSVLNMQSDRTQVHRVGSLAYMSPEQLDGSELDERSDMFSLGGVLYHLVAGRPPFDAANQVALMHQICNATPPPLSALRAGVPARMDEILLRAMAKKVADRYPTLDEFALDWASLVSTQQVPRAQAQEVLDSERFTLLRGLEFFSGFGDVELWEVVHRADWQRHGFGSALFRKGSSGNTFHIITQGQVDVFRDGNRVAQLGKGTSVGEMAYLAPSDDLRVHAADVIVSDAATTVSFTPRLMECLSPGTRHLFDAAFIKVLVRRLHAAHEQMAHPRRIM